MASKNTSRNAVRAGMTELGTGNSNRLIRPDQITINKEKICDRCGVKTKYLRDHNKGMVCWPCKIDLIEQ